MMVESCTQALCDLALRFGEDRSGKKKEDVMVCILLIKNDFLFLFS